MTSCVGNPLHARQHDAFYNVAWQEARASTARGIPRRPAATRQHTSAHGLMHDRLLASKSPQGLKVLSKKKRRENMSVDCRFEPRHCMAYHCIFFIAFELACPCGSSLTLCIAAGRAPTGPRPHAVLVRTAPAGDVNRRRDTDQTAMLPREGDRRRDTDQTAMLHRDGDRRPKHNTHTHACHRPKPESGDSGQPKPDHLCAILQLQL